MNETRPEEYRAKHKPPIIRSECALMVIDAQNDFFSPGGKFVPEKSYYAERVRAIIKPIKKLVEFAVNVSMPVLYSMTQFSPGHIDDVTISRARELGGIVRGTWGAAIITELAPQKSDRVFVFEAQHFDKFLNTNVEILLRRLAVRTVVIVGATTNVCCESTARGARERDFYPVVLSDCVAAFDDNWQRVSMEIIDRFFGSVLTSKEILEILA
jgi:ureidoacrylate peracid hydrolase